MMAFRVNLLDILNVKYTFIKKNFYLDVFHQDADSVG